MKSLALKRLAVVLGVTAIFAVVAAPPSSAVEVGPLRVEIIVDTASWAANGYVGDTLTDATYTCVLTATGFESTGTRNGVIVDFATDKGNPCEMSTDGGFDSQYAVMVYTLTWTSVLGTTGTFTVDCAEVLGQPVCTPS